MKILVTGGAGFIGFHLTKALLKRGDSVVVVDNFNDYYDVSLKEGRAKIIEEKGAKMYRVDISNYDVMSVVFQENSFDKICHLAAQAGVRYSLKHPFLYERWNSKGTLVLLELAKKYKIGKFVFASSSSVYGGNKNFPFSEKDRVDSPISLYAATKKANELYAHVYHELFGLKCVGLRFFTVYGPWGRPDMALFKFVDKIVSGEEIDVYNYGKMERDFTYVNDIVAGILAAIDKEFEFEIFNLGNNNPVKLGYFIELIKKELGRKAKKNMMPMQPGDVEKTFADIDKAKKKLDYEPKTNIEEGVKKSIKWYREYYKKD